MSDTDTTLQLYANPVLIQSRVLDQLQMKLLGDDESVVEGNNPFTFLLEMGATMTSGAILEACEKFRGLYPKRANKASDLYQHMSDYDYVNLYSKPATTAVNLVFDRNFLINNSIVVNSSYKKIIIPEYSTFIVGDYQFGIPYPIEIQVMTPDTPDGKIIENDEYNFNIIWDTTIDNPLKKLITNTLSFYQFKQDNLDMLAISIPVDQFVITTHTEDVIADLGFVKKFSYTDKFYAARIFHFHTGVWNEMNTSLSDTIYDQTKATAQLKVLMDTNELQVIIPQVYFSNNKIGNRVLIKVYTTKGEIDLDITNYNADQFQASFLIDDELTDDKFSSMLKVVPTLYVTGASTRIVGGSNGMTFEQWRDRVVYDIKQTLLITPADVSAHFDTSGFSISNYKDNITDRIYIAQKKMTDTKGILVATADLQTKFTDAIFANLDATYSTIKQISDTSFLVLPSTIYKYDESCSACVPLSDEERSSLSDKEPQQLVNELNANQYSISPYHLKVSTHNDLLLAGTYDLMSPMIYQVLFGSQNPNVGTQISMYGINIQHNNGGAGGYTIQMTLYKTEDIIDLLPVDEQDNLNISVLLRTKNSVSKTMYQVGKFVGTSPSGHSIMEFSIDTNYKLSNSDTLDTSSFEEHLTGTTVNEINLETDLEFLFFISPALVNHPRPRDNFDVGEIPIALSEEVCLLKQTAKLSLGKAVPLLMNNMALGLESHNYLTWPTTEFATYTAPIYARYTLAEAEAEPAILKPNGSAVTLADVGLLKYPIETLHYQGDVIVASPTDQVIPPACIYQSDEEYNLYLESPYTKTSERTNKWLPATEDDTMKIEVVSLLKFACDYSASFDSNSTPAKLQIEVLEDGSSVDLADGYAFAYIADCASDLTSAENELSLGEGGAMYRRNPIFATYDPTSVLTPEELYRFFLDVDNNLPMLTLAEKYDITSSTISKLIGWRTPWIKMVSASTFSKLVEYAEDHDYKTASQSELFVTTLDELDSTYTSSNIDSRNWVYVIETDTWFMATVVESQVNWTPLTEAGLAYVISEKVDTQYVPKHINLLTMSHGKTVLDGSIHWEFINKWPWEVSNWIEVTTGKPSSSFGLMLNNATSAKIERVGGTYIVDENGEPIYDRESAEELRSAIYYVNMLHVDYKLTKAKEYPTYMKDVRNLLHGYFVSLQTAKPLLIEQTELYYAPIKTLGSAYFKGVNETKMLLPLAIEISLRLYVEQYVLDDKTTKSLIRSNILKLVDKHIESGTICCTTLAEQIRTAMSDIVKYIDVLGINGNPELQTLVAVDTDTIPHLKQSLKINDDGSIGVERELNIEYTVV